MTSHDLGRRKGEADGSFSLKKQKALFYPSSLSDITRVMSQDEGVVKQKKEFFVINMFKTCFTPTRSPHGRH